MPFQVPPCDAMTNRLAAYLAAAEFAPDQPLTIHEAISVASGILPSQVREAARRLAEAFPERDIVVHEDGGRPFIEARADAKSGQEIAV